jgi:hypothetical protein
MKRKRYSLLASCRLYLETPKKSVRKIHARTRGTERDSNQASKESRERERESKDEAPNLERLPVGRPRKVEWRRDDPLHEGDVLPSQPLRLLLARVHAHYVLRHQVKRELHSSSAVGCSMLAALLHR